MFKSLFSYFEKTSFCSLPSDTCPYFYCTINADRLNVSLGDGGKDLPPTTRVVVVVLPTPPLALLYVYILPWPVVFQRSRQQGKAYPGSALDI